MAIGDEIWAATSQPANVWRRVFVKLQGGVASVPIITVLVDAKTPRRWDDTMLLLLVMAKAGPRGSVPRPPRLRHFALLG